LKAKDSQLIVLEFLNHLKSDFYARKHLFGEHSLMETLLQILDSSLLEQDQIVLYEVICILSNIC
jgi:hypothetical protein